MDTNPQAARRFPIAEWLNIAVSVLLAASYVALVFGAVMLGVGILTRLSGGTLELPFGIALAEDVSLGGFIVAFAVLVAMVPGVIFIGHQLRAMLSTLSEGEPFVPENARRLVRIALAVAAMEIARYVIAGLAVVLLAGDENFTAPRLMPNLAAWAGVAVLFVLAQVFSEGTRLREEEKMTI